MSANLKPLADRTAIVTGAGSGIGRGIALALASAGANVTVAVRRQATGEATAELIRAEGGKVLVVEADVGKEVDVERAVSKSAAQFGGVDIVIHNANASDSAHPIALEEITDEKWQMQARVTWDGALWLARASLPYLKRSAAGRFVLLGSAFGLHGAGFNPVYAALKGGTRGFTKALAREWGPFGITVNAIQPAAATEPAEVFFNQYPQIRDAFMRNFPLGRMGRPREDIGRAVVAICTDEFGFITAQSIQVDGGLYTAV
jgi:3-oxoacyl-[acyl-carrier protein] reductase